MAEKIKTMGRIEYGLGVMYGIIIAAYSAGLPVADNAIVVAGLFTAAYFGHWAMVLLNKWLDNKILLEQLKLDSRRTKKQVEPERHSGPV